VSSGRDRDHAWHSRLFLRTVGDRGQTGRVTANRAGSWIFYMVPLARSLTLAGRQP
jgi:hypothetical protein